MKKILVAHYGEANQQWSSSYIKKWLNTFFANSFPAEEQKYVLPTDIKGDDGEKISTDKAGDMASLIFHGKQAPKGLLRECANWQESNSPVYFYEENDRTHWFGREWWENTVQPKLY